jgi:hypothetical protein
MPLGSAFHFGKGNANNGQSRFSAASREATTPDQSERALMRRTRWRHGANLGSGSHGQLRWANAFH